MYTSRVILHSQVPSIPSNSKKTHIGFLVAVLLGMGNVAGNGNVHRVMGGGWLKNDEFFYIVLYVCQ